MFALNERQSFRPYLTPTPSPEVGRIIPLPILRRQESHESEWKPTLAYKEGDTPLVKGAKVRLRELGLLQRNAREFETVTSENLMLLLGVSTKRAEKKPGESWHTDDTVEIIFPAEENQIREQVRELVFSQRESEGIDSAVMRFVEFDEDLLATGDGRRFMLQITSLITAHLDPNNRELFELNIILPKGATKEDIFSLWEEGQRIIIEDEEVLLLPSLESAPQFQYGIKTIERLLSKAFSFEIYLNTEQAIEALQLLKLRNEKGNIRPAEIKYKIINGHLCAPDWRGRMVPVFLFFDDAGACREFLEFEKKVVNGSNGDYRFQPSGQPLSAATSNVEPDRPQQPVVNLFIRNNDDVDVNPHATVGPMYTPSINDPPQIFLNPRLIDRNPLFLDPFFQRNIPLRHEFDFSFPVSSRHADRLLSQSSFSPQTPPENNLVTVVAPLFIFPLAGMAVKQRIMETVAASVLVDTAVTENATSARIPEAAIAAYLEPLVLKDIYIAPGISLSTPQSISPPGSYTETSVIISFPQNPNLPGGGGEALELNQERDASLANETRENANSSSEDETTEIEAKQPTQNNVGTEEKESIKATNAEIAEKAIGNSNSKEDLTINKVETERQKQTLEPKHETPDINLKTTTKQEAVITNVSVQTPQVDIMQPTNSQTPHIIFPQIIQPGVENITFQTQLGQIITIPKIFMDTMDWLSLWQIQAELEGGATEVWQKMGTFMSNPQPAVYTVGLIFIILLNLLSGGIILV